VYPCFNQSQTTFLKSFFDGVVGKNIINQNHGPILEIEVSRTENPTW
jgi:hypothetical protein